MLACGGCPAILFGLVKPARSRDAALISASGCGGELQHGSSATSNVLCSRISLWHSPHPQKMPTHIGQLRALLQAAHERHAPRLFHTSSAAPPAGRPAAGRRPARRVRRPPGAAPRAARQCPAVTASARGVANRRQLLGSNTLHAGHANAPRQEGYTHSMPSHLCRPRPILCMCLPQLAGADHPIAGPNVQEQLLQGARLAAELVSHQEVGPPALRVPNHLNKENMDRQNAGGSASGRTKQHPGWFSARTAAEAQCCNCNRHNISS